MKKIIIILLLTFTFGLNAEPAPFGLEITKSKVSDLKSKYRVKFLDTNVYSNGDMYSLDVNQLGIDDLKKATAIFNDKKELVAILTTFPKHKFDYLYKVMNKKYKLSKKSIPFVGNKSAEFKESKSTIFLDAPHLGFESTMNYVEDGFWKTFQNAIKEDQQNKKRKEQSKL